ncbi:uncharacterized protein STEHIDRAFT_79088 [Stereum hirsutum FP-91666 SS1]|uniref:uncharacterized protein n=1 Tax=Stereum hirsutum (strain FP-91666) TaxID=721885 RepID=UPI000440F87E|nr:uncharacterized protein STEHIDRAFT_79088 [Stereum hirsutum FP-91666 SS1]EIM86591.1 hypothetical protein STEHIDRAFT_79088 [Stereum hirsutum FP-91666 SS1]
MVSAPLPVVSSHDATEDEAECPVCLEPLSFSFRLPGEKPHIVPECGHALHEACFTAVYGPPPGPGRTPAVVRRSNLGVCGVCRRPMKIGDGDGAKSNKLAALTGMGNRSEGTVYPGRETPSSIRSHPGRHPSAPQPYDPNEDDPIDHAHSTKSGNERSQYVVAPSIQVRPEFSSITRTQDAQQALTCIVVLELPSKRGNSHVPGPVMLDHYPSPSSSSGNSPRNGHGSQREVSSSPFGRDSSPGPYRQHHQQHTSHQFSDVSDMTVRHRNVSSPPTSQIASPISTSHDRYASSMTGSEREHHQGQHMYSPRGGASSLVQEDESPFGAITEDLRNRIIDWKGHPLAGLGPLQMFDLLSVRRDSLVREFFVYLFKEAIICVAEEKKRSLGRFLSGPSGGGESTSPGVSAGQAGKGVLRLKGRIYIRHIKQVTDTSVQGELSLTIDMEDERLDSFILIFKERPSLETWKQNIQSLVTLVQRPPAQQHHQTEAQLDMEEFGGSSKAARMLSGSTGTTASTTDSLLNGSSSRSTVSSSTSHGSIGARNGGMAGLHHKLSTLDEDEGMHHHHHHHYAHAQQTPAVFQPHMSQGPSNSLTPVPHPPLDLILVISIPPPHALPSTAVLKIRVIKASLDFIIASLSIRDRLSLVTFEVGMGGKVRKTPFLSLGRTQSRARLAKFVDEIGVRKEDVQGGEFEDEFLVRGSKEEKTDVVTAVNHGLDVVLQRKSRNSTAGMVLVSDASDSTRRAQMDLVLARAEAANVPIHSFGYGRSHDPASLWLMSNHTSGTYTFVKDWYDLRDCLAGCVGGMMSIGSMSMKLHMKIVDGNRFRIRKVSGGPSSIVASDGRHVDVDVGELRYGERKEMLVELELDNSDVLGYGGAGSGGHGRGRGGGGRALDATDRFNQSMGLDALAIDDMADLTDGMMDRMIDEVPVFEVDGSFYDPNAGKHVSRLAHPVLLTVTLLPAGQQQQQQQQRSSPMPTSDPVIVRRRMELLASDMITRALVLVSRKNYPQAQKIMNETKRILHTVLTTITSTLPPPSSHGSTIRNRKEVLTLGAVRIMQAILQDMQILSEALEENVELFGHDQRNFGAQQAMILRDQKAWTGRSATERCFWTTDQSIELVGRSTDWVARE